MNPLLRSSAAILLASCLVFSGQAADDLESSFRSPPDEARPWVLWFWINGNISREDFP
ncbi:MAG: hypothetical protein MUF04_05885 [Akkermansiaceae bacterium]|nr:hypothetical protein [Akkermansiaceae bacterium]